MADRNQPYNYCKDWVFFFGNKRGQYGTLFVYCEQTIGCAVTQQHNDVMHHPSTTQSKTNPNLIMVPLTPITYTPAQLHETITKIYWQSLVNVGLRIEEGVLLVSAFWGWELWSTAALHLVVWKVTGRLVGDRWVLVKPVLGNASRSPNKIRWWTSVSEQQLNGFPLLWM